MKQKVRNRKGRERNGGTVSNGHVTKSEPVNGSSSGSFILIGVLLMAVTVSVFLYYPHAFNFVTLSRESRDVQEEPKQASDVELSQSQPDEEQRNPSVSESKNIDEENVPAETNEQTKTEQKLKLKSMESDTKMNKKSTEKEEILQTKPEQKVKSSKVVKDTHVPDGTQTAKNLKISPDSSQKKPELPKEMRDFKPTYLKSMSPKKIFVDGRRLPPVELLPQKPNNSSVRVYLYDEFLSKEECDGLMKVHNRYVEEISRQDPLVCFDSIQTLRKHIKAAKKKIKVSPNDFLRGTTCLNATFSTRFKTWIKSNWSYSTAFYPGESKFSKVFEYRVKQATELAPENGGKFQITSYPTGIGYKTHTDCTEESDDKRDRMGTILVYLQDVAEGGETEFPELGIWVKPRKGRALVWNNMNEDGKCEHLSLHKAAKVTDGHKYILQRWYYYQSFYSLGKRPPAPHLPPRADGQPMVSCDEYEHGSCRWYDEWNYDNILEYKTQKFQLV